MNKTIEKKCHDCGVRLQNIEYLMPDLDGNLPYDLAVRPPLCRECWLKRVKEEKTKVRKALQAFKDKPQKRTLEENHGADDK